ncbi:MAG: bacitracin ABC transporter permease [Rhodococcus sp. (in: high G+C Gram-positive bacteria)]|nr:MAG: bacitracin ABC transporter permease [Rhodococcus sp. (in: high G+C Gram-positive bacteria)]
MTGWAQLRAALAVEWLKFRRARPAQVTTAFLVAGVTALCVLTVHPPAGGSSLTAAKAQSIGGEGGWAGLFTAADTIIAVAGLLGFGVVIGWVFGREFTDGTVHGICAAPVSRAAVAAAKLLILSAWAVATAVGLAAALIGAGLILDESGEPDLRTRVGKFLLVAVLTAALALPCAWVATLARGYLPAVAAVIAVVVLAQMAVLTGIGGWFPFSLPGLWAADTGAVPAGRLLLVLPIPVIGAALTVHRWQRLVSR